MVFACGITGVARGKGDAKVDVETWKALAKRGARQETRARWHVVTHRTVAGIRDPANRELQ